MPRGSSVRYEKGDRVLAIKSGYGKGAGKPIRGTILIGSFGPDNYIRVRWDGAGEDAGFARHFKKLRKMPKRRR